jgi:holo-[acyl-carrier protein] synthase
MEVLGVGVDIVSIERVRRGLEDGGDRFITHVFTSPEREAASASGDPVAYLATAFAAKEAVFKTMDIDWDTGVQLNEVEVHNAPNGRPYVKLNGIFASCARERGATDILLSLSYERDYAVACALLVCS